MWIVYYSSFKIIGGGDHTHSLARGFALRISHTKGNAQSNNNNSSYVITILFYLNMPTYRDPLATILTPQLKLNHRFMITKHHTELVSSGFGLIGFDHKTHGTCVERHRTSLR